MLEELPLAYMSLSWDKRHVISAKNKHQISCKFEILSTLSAHKMCCCATRIEVAIVDEVFHDLPQMYKYVWKSF